MKAKNKVDFSVLWNDLTLKIRSALLKSRDNTQAKKKVKKAIDDYVVLLTKPGSFENTWLENTFAERMEAKDDFINTLVNIELPENKKALFPLYHVIGGFVFLVVSIFLGIHFFDSAIRILATILILNLLSVTVITRNLSKLQDKNKKKQQELYMQKLNSHRKRIEQIINEGE